MSEDDDLRARIDALEAQVDALTRPAEANAGAAVPPPGESGRGQVTRRGLISAAAGAVAGGAAAVLVTTTQDGSVDAHVDDASGAHAASAISLEPSGDLVATDVRAALADLDARLAGLLQYSPDSLQDYAVAYDEFFGASTVTGQVGSLGWSVVTADGGVLRPAAQAVANTPGWYTLATGTESTSGLCVLHQSQVSVTAHPIFVWEMRIATTAASEGAQRSTWHVGLYDDLSGAEPSNGFYFEQADGSANVRCRTAQAGARTDEDSAISLEAGTFYRLRIASDGGGVAYFSIDDEIVATITEGLPSTVRDGYGPTVTIVKTAGTGTSHALRVDYFYLLWGVLALTNVLVVLADDMRADLLPFMPFVNHTLRSEGTQFTNMRCNVPLCNPARAGLLTGQYAQGAANGVYANASHGIADPEHDALAVWLADHATTGMFGKYLQGFGEERQPGWDTWRVLSADEQAAYGYTITDGTTAVTPAEHQLRYLARETSEFIRTAPEPWFCYFAPTNPHVTTIEFTNNPLPESIMRFGWLRWPFVLLEDVSTKPSWIASREQLRPSGLSRLRHGVRQQAREVHDLDAVIAGLHADLAATGRLDDTVIMFASDGGVTYAEQRLGAGIPITTATKNHPYDACARIPCVVRGPGVDRGRVRPDPAVLQDLTATTLGVFEASPTVPQDGIDLRGSFGDRATLYERKGEPAFPDGVGIVDATRKVLRWTDQEGDDRFEAYDLDTDPDELVSWANDPGRRAERDRYEAKLDGLLI